MSAWLLTGAGSPYHARRPILGVPAVRSYRYRDAPSATIEEGTMAGNTGTATLLAWLVLTAGSASAQGLGVGAGLDSDRTKRSVKGVRLLTP
jgi:hypothetical protein